MTIGFFFLDKINDKEFSVQTKFLFILLCLQKNVSIVVCNLRRKRLWRINDYSHFWRQLGTFLARFSHPWERAGIAACLPAHYRAEFNASSSITLKTDLMLIARAWEGNACSAHVSKRSHLIQFHPKTCSCRSGVWSGEKSLHACMEAARLRTALQTTELSLHVNVACSELSQNLRSGRGHQTQRRHSLKKKKKKLRPRPWLWSKSQTSSLCTCILTSESGRLLVVSLSARSCVKECAPKAGERAERFTHNTLSALRCAWRVCALAN